LKNTLTCWLLLIAFIQLKSQNTDTYNCTKLDNQTVELDINSPKTAIKYLGKDVFITKYELKLSGQTISTFFTYKYNSKLYYLDGDKTSLNHTKDPVLFDLPNRGYYLINQSGVFEGVQLLFDRMLDINNYVLYFYKVNTNSTASIQLSEIVFDKNLAISEIKLKSNQGDCSCTKSNIKITLK